MEKAQPGGTAVLHVECVGHAGGEFVEQAIDGMRVRYWLEHEGEMVLLDDLQWADWDGDGRLLAATRSGRLQVRDIASRTIRDRVRSRFVAPRACAGACARQCGGVGVTGITIPQHAAAAEER